MDYFDLPTFPESAPNEYTDRVKAEAGEGFPTEPTKQGDQGNIPRTPIGTPLEHPSQISVSTAFPPATAAQGTLPNLVLVSSDGVHFYVHRSQIVAASSNGLNGLLPLDTPSGDPSTSLSTVHILLSAEILNVVLHSMYGMSCMHYFPSLEVTDGALSALALYGVALEPLAAPNQPLYLLLLSYAPHCPIDAYALAAQHRLEDAAVAVSSHLLAYELSQLRDEHAVKMGSLYLARLFLLRETRLNALRNILMRLPMPHPPSPGCTLEMRQQVTRGWAIATAELAWASMPSVSTSGLRALLEPVGLKLECPMCAVALHQRVCEVELEWASVKRTI